MLAAAHPAVLNVMLSFTAANTRTHRQADSKTVSQLARQTDWQEERLYRWTNQTKSEREMTERWAVKNNRQDTRKQLPDTHRQIQVGCNIVRQFR